MPKSNNIMPHLAPVAPALERIPDHVEWDQLSATKQAALSRVEAQTMAQMDALLASGQAQEKPADNPSRWSVPLWLPTACASLGLLLLVVARWGGTSTTLPQLKIQGQAALAWDKTSSASQVEVKVSDAQSVRLHDAGHWQLQAQPGAILTLGRSSRKHANIKLQRGSIVAHVRPLTMKQFDVHCHHGFAVQVKGTIFAVRQGKGWLRVEVMRGHVEVTHKSHKIATLQQGQGIRFSTPDGTAQHYPVPTGTDSVPLPAMMRWLRHQAPSQLYLYAKDILLQREWQQQQRRELLETIAHLLGREQRHQEASLLWHQLYQWKSSTHEGQVALFNAAQACRRTKAQPRRCLALYRQWLKHFPQGMAHLHESSLYWTIQLLRQTQADKATLHIFRQRYLRRYPKGKYRHIIQAVRR